jgi:hypothetical protein
MERGTLSVGAEVHDRYWLGIDLTPNVAALAASPSCVSDRGTGRRLGQEAPVGQSRPRD